MHRDKIGQEHRIVDKTGISAHGELEEYLTVFFRDSMQKSSFTIL